VAWFEFDGPALGFAIAQVRLYQNAVRAVRNRNSAMVQTMMASCNPCSVARASPTPGLCKLPSQWALLLASGRLVRSVQGFCRLAARTRACRRPLLGRRRGALSKAQPPLQSSRLFCRFQLHRRRDFAALLYISPFGRVGVRLSDSNANSNSSERVSRRRLGGKVPSGKTRRREGNYWMLLWRLMRRPDPLPQSAQLQPYLDSCTGGPIKTARCLTHSIAQTVWPSLSVSPSSYPASEEPNIAPT
jgi:hypothetical protein